MECREQRGVDHDYGRCSGSGNGAVTYSVAPYTGRPRNRNGSATIAGQTFSVKQFALSDQRRNHGLAVGPTRRNRAHTPPPDRVHAFRVEALD